MGDYIYAVVFGMIQGLTEFLPVSSSGHLFAAQHVVNAFVSQDALSFSEEALPLRYAILLHVATLCAVLIFTRRIIAGMLGSCVHAVAGAFGRGRRTAEDAAHLRLLLMVFVATVATLPTALIFKHYTEDADLGNILIGWGITAAVLIIASIFAKNEAGGTLSLAPASSYSGGAGSTTGSTAGSAVLSVSLVQALIVGLVQGVAVFPGLSRSGSTIAAAALVGLTFTNATYFSFLLAIPTILMSFVASLMSDASGAGSSISSGIPVGVEAVSVLSAFVFGLLGLRFLVGVVKKNRLWIFSIYLALLIAAFLVLSAQHFFDA